MGSVQDLRRRRAGRVAVNDSDGIMTYLHAVRAALHLSRAQTRNALEELESHLRDGAAEHVRRGVAPDDAMAMAIDDLGPADAVAAGYNEVAVAVPDTSGAMRWAPMAAPVLLFAVAIGLLAWSVTLFRDGLTVGEQRVQRTYLVSAVVWGAVSCAAYVSIKRARRDRTWRWVAWLCTGFALLATIMT